MVSILKILGSEAACNTLTANTFSSRTIRVFNKGNATQVVNVKANSQPLALLINASANGTTLLTLASGTTANVRTGMFIVNSTNTQVVNTNVASNVATIVNSTAVAVGTTIIIANGTTTVYAVDNTRSISVIANNELILQKAFNDLIDSDSASGNVVITPIAYLG